jgi:hypothetical protein
MRTPPADQHRRLAVGRARGFDYVGETMFDEPEERPADRVIKPADRAREKSDEFRMHAELAAVFEGHRKFDVSVETNLGAELAREIQRAVGRLEKARSAESPVLPEGSKGEAAELLNMAEERGLSTNDYHIHRRPGEAMIVRWLKGEEVETYYGRLQAHFEAALEGYRDDERQAQGWKQDEGTQAYLEALDKIEVKMAERYLREPIKAHGLFVLSTQAADEMNIAYLCEDVMGVSPERVVGEASAPPADGASESDLAWFFKLFSLRGVRDGVEEMCFFAYLQKTEEGW